MARKSKKSTTDSTFIISVNDEEDNDCFSFEDSINTENCVSSFNFTSSYLISFVLIFFFYPKWYLILFIKNLYYKIIKKILFQILI